MALLTVAELKDYVGSELVTKEPFYGEAISTAEAIIRSALVRNIAVAGATATARSFPVDVQRKTLYIHDCTEITSVVVSGVSLVAGTDYRAEPLNGLNDNGEAWPYYKLRHISGAWYPSTSGTDYVVVTAKWGWPSIPPQAKMACRIIAKDVITQGQVKFGLVGFSDLGGVGTRENRLVQDFFARYRHPNAVGFA